MPDWDRVVEAKLPKLKLPETREAEIRSELAGHFAEMHADFLTKTNSEEKATRQTMEEIGDFGALARKIRITEKLGMLNPRLRTFWIPGLMGIAAAMLANIAVSTMLVRLPDRGAAFNAAINHSGLVMAYLGLLLLPAGLVSSGIAWYLGASSLRRVCAALLPLVVFWIALTLVPFAMGTPLRMALLRELKIFSYFGAGLIMGGLPFFFREQRLSFLPRRWLA